MLVNFPKVGSDEKVVGYVESGTIEIRNSNGHHITSIHFNPDYMEGLVESIAHLITQARDAGFEQGRKFIRDALGVK